MRFLWPIYLANSNEQSSTCNLKKYGTLYWDFIFTKRESWIIWIPPKHSFTINLKSYCPQFIIKCWCNCIFVVGKYLFCFVCCCNDNSVDSLALLWECGNPNSNLMMVLVLVLVLVLVETKCIMYFVGCKCLFCFVVAMIIVLILFFCENSKNAN